MDREETREYIKEMLKYFDGLEDDALEAATVALQMIKVRRKNPHVVQRGIINRRQEKSV